MKKRSLTPSSSLDTGPDAHQSSEDHHVQSLLGPLFHSRECLVFSNATPSAPRLSPAAMVSDDMLSAPTPTFHCASILQPATPLHVVAFESWTIFAPICLYHVNLFHFCWITQTWSLDVGVCFDLFLFRLCCSDKNGLRLWVPVYILVNFTKTIIIIMEILLLRLC